MKNIIIAIISLIAVSSTEIIAQNSPAKWGKLRDIDKSLTAVPFDEEAKAVILFDHGLVKFVDEFDLELTVHRRVKILDEAAIDEQATVQIVYPGTGYGRVKVKSIKAQTLNIDDRGKVKKSGVGKREFFTEEVNDYYDATKFTFPQVAVGSILEYEYTLRYESKWLLRDWNFQHYIPTMYSEFVAEIPGPYKYTYNYRGSTNFTQQYSEDFREGYAITVQSAGYANQYGDRSTTTINSGNRQMLTLPAKRHFWVKTDVPALKEEKYITSIDNFRDAVEFQLTAFEYEGTYRNYSETWDKIVSDLYDDEDWGGKLRTIEEKAGDILEGVIITPEMDKVEVIYRWVSENYSMDDHGFSRYSSINTRKLFKEKKGYSVDVNMVLIGLLNAHGVEASPVLVSTRRNGRVVSIFPYIRQFNHVIASVKIGDKYVLMDATEPYYQNHVLPYYDLNNAGLKAPKSRQIEWVSLNPTDNFGRKVGITAKLNSDGTLTGKLELMDSGYAAYFTRKDLVQDSVQKFMDELFDVEKGQMTISNAEVVNQLDYSQSVSMSCDFEIPNAAQSIDGVMYLTALLVGKDASNPFESEQREMPIDFGYGRSFVYSMNLELPEGMQANALPENHMGRFKTRTNYKRLAQTTPTGIQYLFSANIVETEIPVTDYAEFRKFYSALVSDESDVIAVSASPTTTE